MTATTTAKPASQIPKTGIPQKVEVKLQFPVKKINIIPLDGDKSLNQIYSVGIELAILNREDKMITPWVLCKDYLNDLFYGSLYDKKMSIYGFAFDPATMKADFGTSRLLIRNKSVDQKDMFLRVQASVKVLKYFMKRWYEKPTLIRVLGYYPENKAFVLTLPPEILLAPPMLSLFTLLVREGLKYTGKETPAKFLEKLMEVGKNGINSDSGGQHSNDRSYLQSSAKFIEQLNKHGFNHLFSSKLEDNWPKGKDTNIVHNSFGIVSCSGKFKDDGKKYHQFMWGK